LSLYAARRGQVLMMVLILLFAGYIYFISLRKVNFFFKISLIIIIFFICFLLAIYSSTLFPFFFERMSEDTRSSVEYYFFRDFGGRTLDWIVGRGMSGTFYCPVFIPSNRNIIETGYLFLILKGGIINLTFYVFLLLNSFLKGFLKGRNILVKAAAFFLFYRVLYLIPFGLPAFDITDAIVWLCVILCQSPQWRNLNNTGIKYIIAK
jgi:hypothetical protein